MKSTIRLSSSFLIGALVVLGCACGSNNGASNSTANGGQTPPASSSKGGQAGQTSSAAGSSGGASSSSSKGGSSSTTTAGSSGSGGQAGQSSSSGGATGGASTSSAKGGASTTSPSGATAGTGGTGQGGNTSSTTTSTPPSGGTGGSSVSAGGSTGKDAGADASGTGTPRQILLADEGNRRVLLMDMQSPSAAVWSRQIDASKYGDSMRDIQLVGGDRVAVSVAKGYVELDLKTGEIKKEVTSFSGVESLRRLPSGNTILGSNENGVTLQELDSKDAAVSGHKVSFSNLSSLRLFRRTPQGTFLLGLKSNLTEVNWDKQVLWDMAIPTGDYVYMGVRLDKNIVVTSGYGASLLIIEPTGKKVVTTIGGKNQPDATNITPNFYAGFQILANGNYVVTNWEGHGGGNGGKGIQLLEYDASGAVVWKWKQDSKLVSSLHHVIVLDGLDTTKLHDDVNGVLAPVTE
jgi:hypothetical protein